MNLAVIIITYNEEKHIEDAIKNAKQLTDEILLVDSYSSDNTAKIAEENGAKVFFRTWDDDFSSQRNFALDKTTAKWVLYIDADERIDAQLVQSINTVCAKEENSIYEFWRRNTAFGKEFRFGAFRPDKVTRLFPREQAKWVGKVHERVESELKLKVISGYLKHHTYHSWEQYFVKFNKYTTIWSEEAYEKGKRTSLIKAYLRACFAFFKVTFLNFGLLDGMLGLIVCCQHFSYTLAKYSKLYSLQKNNITAK